MSTQHPRTTEELLRAILDELRLPALRRDHSQATMILAAEMLEELKRIRLLLERAGDC